MPIDIKCILEEGIKIISKINTENMPKLKLRYKFYLFQQLCGVVFAYAKT